MNYIFLFGNSPDLALAEIQSLFEDVKPIGSVAALVKVESLMIDNRVVSPQELLVEIGGTVKIAELIASVDDISPLTLFPLVKQMLEVSHAPFGISCYGCGAYKRNGLSEIKTLLEQDMPHVRYVESREKAALSSVVLAKQHIEELDIIQTGTNYMVGKTLAVQPFEYWGDRDYGRPYADAKIGMLPIKVARIIVNIALGNDAKGKIVIDPFCGMGTIIGEAVMRGASAIGSDISEIMVKKSKRNIEWMTDTEKKENPTSWFVDDATHIDDRIKKNSIDAIVTEPFLGTTKIGEGKIEDPEKIRNILKGAMKLYLGCLKSWYPLLKDTGVIVIAIPKIIMNKREYTVKNLVDSCEKLGYTIEHSGLVYGRGEAAVKREFYVLKKKSE